MIIAVSAFIIVNISKTSINLSREKRFELKIDACKQKYLKRFLLRHF